MSFKKTNKKSNSEKKLQNLPVVKESAELMTFLTNCFPGKSRTAIKSLLIHKQILVNQKTITLYNFNLKEGDQVTIIKGKGPEEEKMPGLKILFEDEYLIVIDKAAGLLSIATAEEKEQTAYYFLSAHVKLENPRNHVFVLHRLDRDTSGVMMFAKNQNVQSILQDNWNVAVMERVYTVVVEGKVLKTEGTISSRLKESKAMKVHTTSKPDEGQLAVTHYKVKKQSKNYALLEVSLETGRKNQIRVHMQELGNPVVGDKRYGSKGNPIRRLALHASLLVFKHPMTEAVHRFESPAPKSFNRLLE